MAQRRSSYLYRLLIWVGFASSSALTSYGILAIAITTFVFSLIYVEYDCVISGVDADGGGSVFTIVLIALTQLVGGGTAPGTVRTDGATCAIASVAMSTINVGVRALLFAAGLAALTEVEPLILFTSKVCVSSRMEPRPSWCIVLPQSNRASLSQVYRRTHNVCHHQRRETYLETLSHTDEVVFNLQYTGRCITYDHEIFASISFH